MTPADLRALASRVETEEPSDALWFEVRDAMYPMPRGYGPERERHLHLLAALGHLIRNGHLLEFAAGLMPEGWWVTLEIEPGEVCAVHVCAGHDDGLVNGDAPTEPRARVAAALRARAADLEAGG